MDRNRWIIFAAVCVAVLGFLAYQGGSSKVNFEGDPAELTEQDNVYGNRDAKVVLIEYGDFQCTGCGALYPVLKEVKEEYKDEVAVAYRHLPITTIHPHAKSAAISAQAAAKQGEFWAMHDTLFDNQEEWSQASGGEMAAEYFANYARSVGLDMDQYQKDIEDEAVEKRVERDVAAAQKSGFQLSTPIVVLNGKKMNLTDIQSEGRYDVDKFREVLNEALRKAGVEPPENTGSNDEEDTEEADTPPASRDNQE